MNDTQTKVAIIDDEADMRASVAQWLSLSDFDAVTFEGAETALKALGADFPGIVVSDIRMPGIDGMGLLRKLQSVDPGLPVILMTGHGDVPMAVEAMRIGAYDFIEKPFEPDRLAELCRKASEVRGRTLETRALRRELSDGGTMIRRLLGDSPAVAKLRDTIVDVAQADGNVLIVGETGTGKSLVARALHACGPKASRPMVTLNCAAIPADQIEDVLFGGPDRPDRPLVEQADGGTLCLEDVDALPEAVQARLLDAINATDPNSDSPSQFRILSVSNRMSPTGGTGLRDDLFFRLAGLVIDTPSLRSRGEDILTLFTHFTRQYAEEYGCDAPSLNAADAAHLVQAPWPGNIRQLMNLAERAVLQSRRGEEGISPLLIDDGFQAAGFEFDAEKPLKDHVDAFEKMLIDHALRRNEGSVSAVMAELALPRRTLNEKMSKYGLVRQDYL